MPKSFILKKLQSQRNEDGLVHYTLQQGEELLPLNELLGRTIRLEATGLIFCLGCGKKTGKSYAQGYCFPCSQSRPECDSCMVRPELCHYHKGTCRDANWGLAHCHIPHTIYLAQSSGVKVGITRSRQRLTRWMDQGATQAIVLAEVSQRLDAGLIEVQLKQHYPDKTNFRHMLRLIEDQEDLAALREEAIGYLPLHPPTQLSSDPAVTFQYPVLRYPTKVVSQTLEKTKLVEAQFLGIKGQYLIFDKAVLNIRNHAGYEVTWHCT